MIMETTETWGLKKNAAELPGRRSNASAGE